MTEKLTVHLTESGPDLNTGWVLPPLQILPNDIRQYVSQKTNELYDISCTQGGDAGAAAADKFWKTMQTSLIDATVMDPADAGFGPCADNERVRDYAVSLAFTIMALVAREAYDMAESAAGGAGHA